MSHLAPRCAVLAMVTASFLLVGNVAHAQPTLEARVNLRRNRPTSQRPLRVLPLGTPLTVEGEDTTTNGFFHVVRTERDEVGWASANYVAWAADSAAFLGPFGPRVIGLAAPASRINPDWEWSARQGTTLRNDPDGRSCPARGKKAVKSKRSCAEELGVPAVSHAVTWEALRRLAFAVGLLDNGLGIAKDRPGRVRASGPRSREPKPSRSR